MRLLEFTDYIMLAKVVYVHYALVYYNKCISGDSVDAKAWYVHVSSCLVV